MLTRGAFRRLAIIKSAQKEKGPVMAKHENLRLDDAAAEFYEKNFVPAIFADWASLLVNVGDVVEEQRVLDVACGTGIVARKAAESVGKRGEVTGIDLNPSMLAVARRLHPEINWHEGDVASMPFADGSFDVVFCQAALMFFPDRVAALLEMRRVLRSGGKIAVLVFGASLGYDLTADILEQVAGKEEGDIFRAPFCLRDADQVAALFTGAGFKSVKVETRQGAARFQSLDAFVRTEIDGWVLKGRVDIDAMLLATRDRLRQFTAASGEVRIPIEAHIVTASTY